MARDNQGVLRTDEIAPDDVQKHLKAVNESGQILRDWRGGCASANSAPDLSPYVAWAVNVAPLVSGNSKAATATKP
jgi:hypothetical protein